VLVYAHRSFALDLPSLLHRLDRRAATTALEHDTLVELLVDFAEAESAVADALLPHADDERDDVAEWRRSLDTLSAAFAASCAGSRAAAQSAVDDWRAQLPDLPVPRDPGIVQARTAEGFSCYALYPEQYVDAARQATSVLPGGPVVCVGLRSIGSVLASIVSAVLRAAGREVVCRSVRPRGHPFNRQLILGPALTRTFGERRTWQFLIVDEGPGLSGSSIAGAADAVASLGIARPAITLIPAWRPDPPALRSPRAQRVFADHRVIVGHSPVKALAADALDTSIVHDMSGGLWRSVVFGSDISRWPPTQPQHERVKFADNERAPRAVARFAGLGRRAERMFERARALHEAGFGPRPLGLHNGLVVLEWVAGAPPSATDMARPPLDRIAEYLAFISRAFRTGEADTGDEIEAMLRQNVDEALDADAARAIDALIAHAPRDGARVAVDGRLLPIEWIRSGGRLFKVDALDHHADDFLPGCRDIAWDLAGACVEWQLPAEACDALVNRFAALSGDEDARRRLPFFTAAYLAYRLGYVSLAAESLAGTPDAAAFTQARERYRRSLAAHAAHPHRVAAR
jgi:hypothetical protein